jgi:hypothetical protein
VEEAADGGNELMSVDEELEVSSILIGLGLKNLISERILGAAVKESSRVHLWHWMRLQSATPSQKRSKSWPKKAKVGAMLNFHFPCITTLSIDLKLTSDNSATDAKQWVWIAWWTH